MYLILLFKAQLVFSLSVTSLNIEWFGKGGEIQGQIEDEYRSERVHDFLTNYLPKSDVFVFQEVTEPTLVKNLFSNKNCLTYDSSSKNHQHIVVSIPLGSLIKKYIQKEVQLGSLGLRPAIEMQILNNKKLYTIIGVHLKAGPEDTLKRLKQVRLINSNLKKSHKTVIIGDFNTFEKDRTGLDISDNEYINQILEGFNEVPLGFNTFLGFGGRLFDRAWIKNLNLISHNVYGPCNQNQQLGPYTKIGFYSRFISDHCAIQIVVD